MLYRVFVLSDFFTSSPSQILHLNTTTQSFRKSVKCFHSIPLNFDSRIPAMEAKNCYLYHHDGNYPNANK